MIRKLFSVTLCAFALLLLMGASSVPEQTVTIVAEEGSVPTNSGVTLETDKVSDEAVHGAAGASLIELAENTDSKLLIDGVPAPSDVARMQKDGITYVSLAGMAKALDDTAQVQWDSGTGVATVTTATLNVTVISICQSPHRWWRVSSRSRSGRWPRPLTPRWAGTVLPGP